MQPIPPIPLTCGPIVAAAPAAAADPIKPRILQLVKKTISGSAAASKRKSSSTDTNRKEKDLKVENVDATKEKADKVNSTKHQASLNGATCAGVPLSIHPITQKAIGLSNKKKYDFLCTLLFPLEDNSSAKSEVEAAVMAFIKSIQHTPQTPLEEDVDLNIRFTFFVFENEVIIEKIKAIFFKLILLKELVGLEKDFFQDKYYELGLPYDSTLKFYDPD